MAPMRPHTAGRKFLCMLGTLVLGVVDASSAPESLRIAVAANFRPAAEAFASQFIRDTGLQVVISSASTGVLATQLRNGAPFDVLLAADESRPRALVEEGLSLDGAHCYARGSLVLLGTDDMTTALGSTEMSIAIANPRSAPYGAAALAVLHREGVAGPQTRRVVMGSNVQQAYQFWSSGATDLALVARSLSPGRGLAVPGDWHAPIDQYAIVSAKSRQPARAQQFLTALVNPGSRKLLTDFGYEVCE